MRSLRGLSDYLGRAGAALRTGRPRVDLTLLNGQSAVNGIGGPPGVGTTEILRPALQQAGYSWDVLDPVSVPRPAPFDGAGC